MRKLLEKLFFFSLEIALKTTEPLFMEGKSCEPVLVQLSGILTEKPLQLNSVAFSQSKILSELLQEARKIRDKNRTIFLYIKIF